jgi:peptidoglycan/LPS O-acetylase OafA/YrhL
VHGIPDLAEVAVFIAGALAGFGALVFLVRDEPDARAAAHLDRARTRALGGGALARGRRRRRLSRPARPRRRGAGGASCGATVVLLVLASAQLEPGAHRR